MKVILVLFLVGFALTASNPLYDLGQIGGVGEYPDDLDYNKHALVKVKEILKVKFDNFLEKVRDVFKGGEDIKDDILKKGKEIKEKFKLLKEQIDKEGKDFFKKLLDHGRDYLKQIFQKLGVNDKRAVDYHVEAIMQAEEKDDIIWKLKDKFQEVVKKVKDAIEQGKSLKNGLETLEKIRQKLKDFNIDLGDFGNEYLEQLKDKVKDYWNKLKDRLGVTKRIVKATESIDVVTMIHEFKKLIEEEFNPEKVKAFVEKYVGENKELVEALTQLIKENGKENTDKILDFLRKLLKEIIGARKSSTDDVFEEIREFFKDLGIEIKDRFVKFGAWVREQYQRGLQKSKNRLENVKTIAKEFSRKISKDVAKEAREFFREYRKDLGDIFDDIEAKVKDILKQD